MARPTKYSKRYAKEAEKLCILGATDDDLADFFGVSQRTIERWKQSHPEFCQSLKQAKEVADAKVVKSLYQRATGYDHIDTHFASYAGEIVSEEYMKHWPPDVTACIFWLKNRQPEHWRDVHEITGDLKIYINEKFKDGNKA